MQAAYRALADPHRRTILRVLRGGERTAGDLADAAGLQPAALTHHLTVLKLADLVRVERRGQYQVYSLNTTVFQDFVAEILSWLTEPVSHGGAAQGGRPRGHPGTAQGGHEGTAPTPRDRAPESKTGDLA